VDINPLAESFDPGNQLLCDGEVVNISGGGLHFRSKTKLPLNTVLGLFFAIPGLGFVDAMAEVVRVS